MPERFKFTVWRDRWLRGDAMRSCLLDGAGHQCCVGFLAEARAVPRGYLNQRSVVASLPNRERSKLPEFLNWNKHGTHDAVAMAVYNTNDDRTIDDAAREAELTKLFAAQGIDVEFRDGSGPE
jgi:hypothetical protein